MKLDKEKNVNDYLDISEIYYDWDEDQVLGLLEKIFAEEDVLEISYEGIVNGIDLLFSVIPIGKMSLNSEALGYLEILEEQGVFDVSYQRGKFDIIFKKKDLQKRVGVFLNGVKRNKKAIRENKDYTSSYPNTDSSSHSYVMLSLALGQAKFHEPAVNTLARLPEGDEDSMIETGVKVIEGKMTSDAYVDKLFSILKKLLKNELVILGKEKSLEDFMRTQIELRVRGNSSGIVNKNLKETYVRKSDIEREVDKTISSRDKEKFENFYKSREKVFLKKDKTSPSVHLASRVFYKDEYGVWYPKDRVTRTYVYINPAKKLDFAKVRVKEDVEQGKRTRRLKEFKQEDADRALKILTSMYEMPSRNVYGNEADVYNSNGQSEIIIYIPTGDRGPRTDHGGGDDGEGWMSNSEINRVAAPYFKKWKPVLKKAIVKLKENGFRFVSGDIDYGEKGHVSLQFRIFIRKAK